MPATARISPGDDRGVKGRIGSRGRIIIRAIAIGLPLALGAGCSGPRLTSDPANQVRAVADLPPPNPVDLSRDVANRPYVIGAYDILNVWVLGNDDLSVETQVDSGGQIQLALVGSIEAAGKTPEQLSHDLAEAYDRSFLKHPKVSVSVKEIRSQLVTVSGSVKHPGVYPVTAHLTLTGALALAQGTDEFAALDNVAVFRTVNTKKMAAIFNMRDIRTGKYADPEIYPNDVIVVGNSPVRRLFRDIVQTAPFVAVFRPFN